MPRRINLSAFLATAIVALSGLAQGCSRNEVVPIGEPAATAAAPAATQPAREWKGAPGTFQLPSGETVAYAYWYNRNALADAVLLGDSVLALTDSGNLIRFDVATRRPVAEHIRWPAAKSCLPRRPA
jgi:hypothetical protein